MARYGDDDGRDDSRGSKKGDAVRDGFTCVGRRPRGVPGGNIVDEASASEYEDREKAFDEVFGDEYDVRRKRRLNRMTRDILGENNVLDHEG